VSVFICIKFFDLNSNGCADDEEAENCPICVNSNDDNTSSENDDDPFIDPDDVTTVAVVGGTGIVGGGLLDTSRIKG
jgi:hypothetical protein